MKILVVKMSSMGDVIHTLPALTDASNALENLHFDWVVEEGFAEIPRWHTRVDNVIPVALRRWRKQPLLAIQSGEVQHFFHKLRERQYDYIIDAQGLVKSALLTGLSKGKRCGLDFNSAREPLAALFYQQRNKVAKAEHAVTRTRQLFSQILNYPLPTEMPHYGIDTQRLKSHPTLANLAEKTLLFIHGTSRDNKCWPEAHWIELGNLAHQAGYTVQIVWGNEEERQRSERIAAACPSAKVTPKLKLAEVAALLSQTKAAVAVDTGLGHLAAALGTPTISLYVPTDPKLIGAYGPSQTHLSAFNDIDNSMTNLFPERIWATLQL